MCKFKRETSKVDGSFATLPLSSAVSCVCVCICNYVLAFNFVYLHKALCLFFRTSLQLQDARDKGMAMLFLIRFRIAKVKI